MNKYCQGPKCHQLHDKQTGNVDQKAISIFKLELLASYGYGNGSFCTMNCQVIGGRKHGTRAVDHIGRIREPIKLVHEKMRGLKIMTIGIVVMARGILLR